MRRLIRILVPALVLAALAGCRPPVAGHTLASEMIYDPNFYYRTDYTWMPDANFLYRGLAKAPPAEPAR